MHQIFSATRRSSDPETTNDATSLYGEQIDAKYELIKSIGHGAYGVVISAVNKETGQKVAIKKITRAFDDLVDAKRILREITLLRKFGHDNVRALLPLMCFQARVTVVYDATAFGFPCPRSRWSLTYSQTEQLDTRTWFFVLLNIRFKRTFFSYDWTCWETCEGY